MKKCILLQLQKHSLTFVVIGKVPMLYCRDSLQYNIPIPNGKCNEIVWDSFFHISVGLNSLPGSCVPPAGPPMGLGPAATSV